MRRPVPGLTPKPAGKAHFCENFAGNRQKTVKGPFRPLRPIKISVLNEPPTLAPAFRRGRPAEWHMPDRRDLLTTPAGKDGTARSAWRFVPLVAIAALSILIWLMGWHRHLTFESFVHQHAALHGFIARDLAGSVAAYMITLCPRGGTVGARRAAPDGGGRHLVRCAPGWRGGIDRRDGRGDLHLSRSPRARSASIWCAAPVRGWPA